MSNYEMLQVEAFVDKIIQDLPSVNQLQKQRQWLGCGSFLKQPLPFDTANNPQTQYQLIDSLLHHVGRNDDIVQVEILNTRVRGIQDGNKIYVASATSGMGKTHLAYQIGKVSYAIIVRVSKGMRANLTLPWETLTSKIKDLNLNCLTTDNSITVLKYIELLMVTYIEVSSKVISLCKEKGLTDNDSKEVLLRFHRNGTAELIVDEQYQVNISNLSEEGRLIRERVNLFIHDIIQKWPGTCQPIICLDEVQALLNSDIPNSVCIQNAFYETIKKSIQDGHDAVDPKSGRGIFYALTAAIYSLCTTCVFYLSGTKFTMSRVDIDGNLISPLRDAIQYISFNDSLFKASHMVALLSHYWSIEDGFLNSHQVISILNKFEGRPYYFCQHVFSHLVDSTTLQSILNTDKTINEDAFISFLESCFSSVTQYIRCCIDEYFDHNLPISAQSMKCANALLPILVKALVFGNGSFDLTVHESHDAIRSALLPMDRTVLAFNLYDREPTLCALLLNKLKSILDQPNGFGRIMDSLIDGSGHEEYKGQLMENMLAYYVSLKVFQRKHKSRYVPYTLYELLQPLLGSDGYGETATEGILSGYRCHAFKIVNCKDESLCFEKLFDAKGQVRFDVILVKIDPACGIDMAMAVEDSCDYQEGSSIDDSTDIKGDPRLAVFQLKNKFTGGFSEAVGTLSPGLQYCSNAERSFILGTSEKPSSFANRGYFGSKRKKFCDFISQENHRFCGEKWLRFATLGKAPDDKTINKIKDFAMKNEDSFENSPISVISLAKLPKCDLQAISKQAAQLSDEAGAIGFPRMMDSLVAVSINEADDRMRDVQPKKKSKVIESAPLQVNDI